MRTEVLSIGEVANRTGVSISAIRYYDEEGLIGGLSRVGGKRRFPPEAVRQISFLRRARDVGFTLGEIRSILDEGPPGWKSIVDAKQLDLLRQRGAIDTMIEVLSEISECGCEAIAECDLVDFPASVP